MLMPPQQLHACVHRCLSTTLAPSRKVVRSSTPAAKASRSASSLARTESSRVGSKAWSGPVLEKASSWRSHQNWATAQRVMVFIYQCIFYYEPILALGSFGGQFLFKREQLSWVLASFDGLLNMLNCL